MEYTVFLALMFSNRHSRQPANLIHSACSAFLCSNIAVHCIFHLIFVLGHLKIFKSLKQKVPKRCRGSPKKPITILFSSFDRDWL